MTSNEPLTLDAYQQLADAYAARIDTKPHNAYYERPAMLSMLPDVAGLHVFDAGCGPGVYAQWLAQRGARVVAVDYSARMIAHARARAGTSVEYHHADLQAGLGFLDGRQFDIVLAALVLDGLADWRAVFRRWHALLRPGGLLLFSAGHPSFDAIYFKTSRYAETEQVTCTWRGFGIEVEMPSYRRSLSEVINPVIESGFELLQLLEPQPTEEFKKADPVTYARLLQHPGFICIKARRRDI
jgi:SAM-dependent methyltransferase